MHAAARSCANLASCHALADGVYAFPGLASRSRPAWAFAGCTRARRWQCGGAPAPLPVAPLPVARRNLDPVALLCPFAPARRARAHEQETQADRMWLSSLPSSRAGTAPRVAERPENMPGGRGGNSTTPAAATAPAAPLYRHACRRAYRHARRRAYSLLQVAKISLPPLLTPPTTLDIRHFSFDILGQNTHPSPVKFPQNTKFVPAKKTIVGPY